MAEKDANAILCKYGNDAITKAVEGAEIEPVKFVKQMADVKSVDIYSMPKIKTGIHEIDKAIGGIYLGQVVLLSGKRGEGKSTFMSQICVESVEQDYNTFIYSGSCQIITLNDGLIYKWQAVNISPKKINEYGEPNFLSY